MLLNVLTKIEKPVCVCVCVFRDQLSMDTGTVRGGRSVVMPTLSGDIVHTLTHTCSFSINHHSEFLYPPLLCLRTVDVKLPRMSQFQPIVSWYPAANQLSTFSGHQQSSAEL